MRTGEGKETELRKRDRQALMLAMGRSRDWKSREAREMFRRPGFAGTVLEGGRNMAGGGTA